MGHGKRQRITVQYSDKTFETFENVESFVVDNGFLDMFMPDSEMADKSIVHTQRLIPLHRVAQVKREVYCTVADHKASEAMQAAWADRAMQGIRLVSGMADEEEDGA